MRFFTWLKSLFSKNKTTEGLIDSYEMYLPHERMIYSYFDGQRIVKGDPLVLYKEVMAVRGDLAVDMRVSTSPMKGADIAHSKVVGTIRKIFNLSPLDKGGLSELETIALLDHFLVYTEAVKKNSSPSQTSSTPTADFTSSSPPNPPISPSSDSGSTENESKTDGQESLHSDAVSQTAQ